MKYGVCAVVATAGELQAQGWDYVEESVQGLLHAHDQTAAEWRGGDLALASPLPIRCANLMVPASLKVTGPAADVGALAKYMSIMLSRAHRVGIKTIVFGSGGARAVPDGFDRAKATAQIVSFLKSAAPVAADHDITIAIEHLNVKECNILTTVEECADVARQVDHPAVAVLFDTYHFWLDKNPISQLRAALPLIRHVHVADEHGRVAPGTASIPSNYREVFRVLKEAGYDRTISVEARDVDVSKSGSVLEFLRREWAAA